VAFEIKVEEPGFTEFIQLLFGQHLCWHPAGMRRYGMNATSETEDLATLMWGPFVVGFGDKFVTILAHIELLAY
jgi:hypothetical protein